MVKDKNIYICILFSLCFLTRTSVYQAHRNMNSCQWRETGKHQQYKTHTIISYAIRVFFTAYKPQKVLSLCSKEEQSALSINSIHRTPLSGKFHVTSMVSSKSLKNRIGNVDLLSSSSVFRALSAGFSSCHPTANINSNFNLLCSLILPWTWRRKLFKPENMNCFQAKLLRVR